MRAVRIMVANEGGMRRLPRAMSLSPIVSLAPRLCFRITGPGGQAWLLPAENETAALTTLARRQGHTGLVSAGRAWLLKHDAALVHVSFAVRLPTKLETPRAVVSGGMICPWCGTPVHD